MLPTLLLTRPLAQAQRFAAACRDRFDGQAQVVISPILTITLEKVTLALPEHTVLIFSSENAVRAFAQTEVGAGRTAFCVGDRTADAATQAGLRAISAGGTAEDLIARISAEVPKAATLAYLHGSRVRVDIAKALEAKGYSVASQAVYAQLPTDLTPEAQRLLMGAAQVVLPIFSPRSAELLGTATASSTAPLCVVALSDNVAQAWTQAQSRIDAQVMVASHPDAAHMLEAIGSIFVDTLP